jgi:16S rRNA (guanine966-N2)-methyltransferase
VQRKRTQQVRIIGGVLRSRIVRFPTAAGLRPTPDRVRETLFNWLGQDLSDKRCLDLFAGAGALGFEAISRGASEVVMVEKSRVAFSALRENAARLGIERARMVLGDALHFLRASESIGTFDVVFVDPPYESQLVPTVLSLLPKFLAPAGSIYVEGDSSPRTGTPWRVHRQAVAGAVHYCLLKWGIHDQGSLSGDI